MKTIFFVMMIFAPTNFAEAKKLPPDYGPKGPTASDFVIDTFSGNRQRPPATVDYKCNWNFRLKRCFAPGYPQH